MSIFPSRTIAVAIDCAAHTVYDFIVKPQNLPVWAPGFARAVHHTPKGWVVETATAPLRVEFVEWNRFGVADHRVTLSPGVEVLNPVRVIANGDGAQVLFTVFQRAGLSEEQFAADAAAVESDLRTLKHVLERPSSDPG